MKATAELTQQDIILIESYTNKGKGDEWIVQKLGIKRHVVAKITTDYWKRKMKS